MARLSKLHTAQIILFLISIIFSHASAANRRLCGSNLADALRLLCQGTYKSRAARDVRLRTAREINSGGVAQECCTKACDVPTLLSYCGSAPANNENSFMSSVFSLKPAVPELSGSKFSQSLPPQQDAPAASAPSGKPRNGRYQDTISKLGNFDISPLLDSRLQDYDNIPYRQR